MSSGPQQSHQPNEVGARPGRARPVLAGLCALAAVLLVAFGSGAAAAACAAGAVLALLWDRRKAADRAAALAAENSALRRQCADGERVAAALQVGEARFRAMVEDGHDGFNILNPDGTIVYSSPANARLLGYRPEEIAGRPAFTFVHPDDLPAIRDAMAALVRHPDRTVTVCCRLEHKTDTWRWFEGTARNRSAHPELRGVVVSWRDTTERRAAEEQLSRRVAELTVLSRIGQIASESRTEDELLRRATDLIAGTLSPDNCGFLLLDPARGALVTHPSFVLSDPAVSVADKPLGTGITGTVAQTGRAVRTGDVSREPAYLAADARTRSELCVPVRAGAAVAGVINVESQKPGAFSASDEQMVTTVADVVGNALERLRSGAAVAALGAFRETVIRTAAEGICVCVPAAEFPFVVFSVWNERMTEITGYTMAEINRAGWYQALYPDPDVRARAAARMDRMRDGDDLVAEEWTITRKDGAPRTVAISTSLMQSEGARAVIALMQDVTARKRAEDEQRRLGERLRQAEKMEAVGQLAGGVAHDFNNLLTVINGYCGVLAAEVPEGSSWRRMAAEALDAGERAAELTRQLLSFGRKQALRPRALDPNRAVARAEGLLRRLLPENIRIQLVLGPSVRPVVADEGQLVQALLNLGTNARDAMPAGGQLVIQTDQVELTAEQAALLSDMAPGPHARLSVRDTGCGMDEDTRRHLFEPFFTTKDVGKGTGLGLASVYGAVKQSAGHIEVSSAPGRGTTFTIFLPSAGAIPDAPGAQPPDPVGAPTGHTVLLVEDEPQVRAFAATVLRRAGYAVLEARHGADGLRRATEAGAPRLDLVISDVVMPEMSGPEMVDRLTALNPGLRHLFVTGYPRSELNGHAGRHEFVLGKPFSPKQLLAAAQAALARREPVA